MRESWHHLFNFLRMTSDVVLESFLEAALRQFFCLSRSRLCLGSRCLGLASVSNQVFGLGSASLVLARPRLGLEVSASVLPLPRPSWLITALALT